MLAWNPDVILALDPQFYRSVATDPLWSSVKAVRAGHIYLAPSLPYGWFDAPPRVNRLMGVRWLQSVLYPRQFPQDLREAFCAVIDQGKSVAQGAAGFNVSGELVQIPALSVQITHP